jgi:hypothetical protein
MFQYGWSTPVQWRHDGIDEIVVLGGDFKPNLASAEGVVVVLDAGGTELKILAKNDFGSAILATPAIVDGRIDIRTEGHLYAFGD